MYMMYIVVLYIPMTRKAQLVKGEKNELFFLIHIIIEFYNQLNKQIPSFVIDRTRVELLVLVKRQKETTVLDQLFDLFSFYKTLTHNWGLCHSRTHSDITKKTIIIVISSMAVSTNNFYKAVRYSFFILYLLFCFGVNYYNLGNHSIILQNVKVFYSFYRLSHYHLKWLKPIDNVLCRKIINVV